MHIYVCECILCVYVCMCEDAYVCIYVCECTYVRELHVCVVFCVQISVKVHMYGLVWRSEVSLMYFSTELHLTYFEVESLIGLELS